MQENVSFEETWLIYQSAETEHGPTASNLPS